jgi:hypothetical protein
MTYTASMTANHLAQFVDGLPSHMLELAATAGHSEGEVLRAVAAFRALDLGLDIARLVAYRGAVQAGIFTDYPEGGN